MTEALISNFRYKDGNLIRVSNGKPCGSPRKAKDGSRTGYKVLAHGGSNYYAHRIIWMLNFGAIPEGMQIDHINGDRSDNRIENLRCVSVDDNMRNRAASKRRFPGRTGVNYCKRDNLWHAMIYDKNKHISFGYFRSYDEAVRVRVEAERRLGYHPNHGKREILY